MSEQKRDGGIQDEIILLGGITDLKIASLRLILATAALAIIVIDPTEPDRYAAATYLSLIAFTIYSLLIHLRARPWINFPDHIVRRLIWIDIAWSTILVSLSSGTSSVFYFFYMFEIIVASSRGGRKLGLAVVT